MKLSVAARTCEALGECAALCNPRSKVNRIPPPRVAHLCTAKYEQYCVFVRKAYSTGPHETEKKAKTHDDKR